MSLSKIINFNFFHIYIIMTTPEIKIKIDNYRSVMSKLIHNQPGFEYSCLYDNAMNLYAEIIDANNKLRNDVERKIIYIDHLINISNNKNIINELIKQKILLQKFFRSIIDPKTPKTILQRIQ